MLFDYLAMFGQDVDAYATGDVGSEVDLGADGLDVGKGEPVYLGIAVGTAYAGITDITFNLQSSATSGSGHTTLVSTKAYTAAELGAGAIVKLPVPDGLLRYCKVTATVSGTGTAGAVTAGFVK